MTISTNAPVNGSTNDGIGGSGTGVISTYTAAQLAAMESAGTLTPRTQYLASDRGTRHWAISAAHLNPDDAYLARTVIAESITDWMLSTAVGLLPLPQPVSAFVASATTQFVDPDATFNGDGTAYTQAASGGAVGAFNVISSATFQAGRSVLVKAGATASIGTLTLTHKEGTEAAPIVLGAYDGSTGYRIPNAKPGSIKMDAGGATAGLTINGTTRYFCVEGLKVTNTSDSANGAGIYLSTNSNVGQIQILNCDVRGLAGHGIFAYPSKPFAGLTIQGCLAGTCSTASRYGILIEAGGTTLTLADITLFYNTVTAMTGTSNSAIAVTSDAATHRFVNLRIAGNTTNDNTSTGSQGGHGINLVGVSAPGAKIWRNTALRNAGNGINISGANASSADMLIQNNDSHNNQYGIFLTAMRSSPVEKVPSGMTTPTSATENWVAPMDGTLIVASGTVSAVTLTKPGSSAVTVASATDVQIPVTRGDKLVFTYSVTPTLTFTPAIEHYTGKWVVEYNRCWYNGSLSNSSPAYINANKYGRGIETYGSSAASRCEGGVIRHNSCCYTYNFGGALLNGTEGVGLGLDGNSYNIDAYGNYCAYNEGNGIQYTGGVGCRIYGNLCVENMAVPVGLRGSTIQESGDMSVYGYNETSDIYVFNNTIVCGENANGVQKYGITDRTSGSTAKRLEYRNNLILNAAVAGIRQRTTTTTLSNNAFSDCAESVIDTTGAVVTLDGASVESTGLAVAPWYTIAAGGLCDAAGTPVYPAAVGFDGVALGNEPPIGAMRVRYS